MPVYDFECPDCGKVEYDITVEYKYRNMMPCIKSLCKGILKRLPSAPAARVFKRGVYEHIGPDPIYIDSAKELSDACKANGAVSPYLEDSPYRRHLK